MARGGRRKKKNLVVRMQLYHLKPSDGPATASVQWCGADGVGGGCAPLPPASLSKSSTAHFLTSPVGMDAYEAQALPAAAGGSEAQIKYFRAIGSSEGWFTGVVASLQVFEAREQIKLGDWQRWRRIPQAAELLGPQREPYHRRGLGEDDTWALAHAAAHAPPPPTPPPADAPVAAEAGGDAEDENKKAASADGKDEEKKADDGNGK